MKWLDKQFDGNIRWMNEKNIDELKKNRRTFHIIVLILLQVSLISLVLFSYYWFFTNETLYPFFLAIITVLLYIEEAVYILKRDNLSVLIYLKEVTEEHAQG